MLGIKKSGIFSHYLAGVRRRKILDIVVGFRYGHQMEHKQTGSYTGNSPWGVTWSGRYHVGSTRNGQTFFLLNFSVYEFCNYFWLDKTQQYWQTFWWHKIAFALKTDIATKILPNCSDSLNITSKQSHQRQNTHTHMQTPGRLPASKPRPSIFSRVRGQRQQCWRGDLDTELRV